jgi:hypothetical protein
MEAEGTLDCNLTAQQWLIVADTCVILKPFMFAQRTFEGEKYVTISLIPYVLYKIRSLLEEVRNSAFTSFQVANLIRKMANAFEDHWGCGEPGTVATENLVEGRNRRPRGIPLLTLVASLLDPRFKFGPGLADLDKDYIWNVILHQMIGIDRSRTLAQQQAQQEQAQQEGHHQDDNQEHHNDDAFHDMFDELNALRMAEGIAEINPVQGEDQAAVTSHDRARAELLMYRGEPALALQKEDRSYNNPLEWWRVKAQQFPLLSELAIKYLCIPATSAPSERVFSSAGLTISKERSRLDPSTANELVFLHETIPAMKRYKASIEAIADC